MDAKRLVDAFFAKDPQLKKAAEEAGFFKELNESSTDQEDEPKIKEITDEDLAKESSSKATESTNKDTEKKDEVEPLEIEVTEDVSKPHFDRYFARVIRRLKSKGKKLATGEEYAKLGTDKARFQFVRHLEVMDVLQDLYINHEKKNYEQALLRRETGNGMFKKRYYADAHELYTQSIQLFPKELNNEMQAELAKSFANRATTACHMNEYSACLVDIQRAFDLGYPDNLKYKMYEKQAKCYKHFKLYDKSVESLKKAVQVLSSQNMEKDKKSNIISDLKKQLTNCEALSKETANEQKPEIEVKLPEPTKGRHSTVTNASSLIDITFDEVNGRQGVAKQDIHVGDIVVTERPYTSILLPPFYDTHCYCCYKRLKSPVGCDHCSSVRFCDNDCRDRMWDHHKYECGLLYFIDSTDNCWGHLAYRIVVKLGFQRLVEFKKFLEENDSVKWNQYGANGEPVTSEDYKCVHALITHAGERHGADLFSRSVKAAYLLKCLQHNSFFPEGTDQDVLDFTGGLLLSNLQLCPCNAHEVSELQVHKSDLQKTKTAEIGAGLYPTLSLFNHSCDPNVVRYYHGNFCITRAIHHIKKGEPIVDSYGALYPTQKLADRRKHLEQQYFFHCQCKPCTMDWPLYQEMPDGEEAPPILKCEKCGDALMPEQDVGLDDWPCGSCSAKHNILQRMQALDQSHDRFASAIEAVLKGDNTAVRALEQHLDLMDKLLYLPWKMFNNAQEALKHNYGVAANCFALP